MDANRYALLQEIFEKASTLDEEARAEYIVRACGTDTDLLRQVNALLARSPAHSDRDDAFAEKRLDAARRRLDAVIDPAMRHPNASNAPPVAESPLPEFIGRYRVVRRIGIGGMGVVYEAVQEEPRRTVAIKIIRRGMSSRQLVRRFQHEAEILGQLKHPGIAHVYDAGTHDDGDGGQPYFAMEYIDGVPLTTYARENSLTTAARLKLLARICDAVHHAHQKGIIHRDLKPDNILVTPAGDPKVLDFGVARVTDGDLKATMHTSTGQLIGTLAYMSPEQVGGNALEIDTRSDVYALGVVLFELLTDRLPNENAAATIPEIVRAIQEDEPTTLSSIDTRYRGDVDTIVAKATEKDPDRRFGSAAELAADLRRHLQDEPITARRASRMYRMRKFTRRNRSLVIGTSLAVTALVAGLVVSIIFAIGEANQRHQSNSTALAARHLTYRTSIMAAADALTHNDLVAAQRHLDVAEETERGWEWHHLAARLETGKGTTWSATPLKGPIAYRNGRLVCVALDESGAKLVDVISGETLMTFNGVALSEPTLTPDGARLSARSGETAVMIWSTEDGRLIQRVEIEPDMDYTLGPNGAVLALVPKNRTPELTVIDVESGRVRFTRSLTLQQPTPDATWVPGRAYIAICDDGARVAWLVRAGRDAERLLLLDGESGRTLHERQFSSRMKSIVFAAGGKRLAVSIEYGPIHIVDGRTLEQVASLRGHSHGGAQESIRAAHPVFAGEAIVTASGDGKIRVWDVVRGEPMHVLDTPGRVGQLAVPLDYEAIASTGIFVENGGLSDRNWIHAHPLVTEPSMTLRGHEGYVYYAAWSPDGAMIATAAWDDTVRLWDSTTGAEIATLEAPLVRHRGGLSFSDDGSRLVAIAKNQTFLWDLATHERTDLPQESEDRTHGMRDAKYKLEWFHTLWSQGGGDAKYRLDNFHTLVTSPDGTLVAGEYAAIAPVPILVSEVASNRQIAVLDGHPLTDQFAARWDSGDGTETFAFSHDNAWLVTGGVIDGTVRVWDLSTGLEIAAMAGHRGVIHSVDVSPDGSRIVSGGGDGTIRLWDTATFEQVLEFEAHGSYVHAVAFSPDGTRIVSASGDQTVKIWDTVSRSERLGTDD